MTAATLEVSFHTGVAEPVGHALRLIRKALSQGLRVLTVGPAEQLAVLDEVLWTAEPAGFVPHARVGPGASPAPTPTMIHRASVVLVEPQVFEGRAGATAIHGLQVLINLGADVQASTTGCSKVIEVVGLTDEARSVGQARWRAYRQAGLQPTHHAVSAS